MEKKQLKTISKIFFFIVFITLITTTIAVLFAVKTDVIKDQITLYCVIIGVWLLLVLEITSNIIRELGFPGISEATEDEKLQILIALMRGIPNKLNEKNVELLQKAVFLKKVYSYERLMNMFKERNKH